MALDRSATCAPFTVATVQIQNCTQHSKSMRNCTLRLINCRCDRRVNENCSTEIQNHQNRKKMHSQCIHGLLQCESARVSFSAC